MITNDIRPLLDRYVRFIGRGNMVPASLVLVDVIKRLVLEIEASHATNGQQSARPYDVTAVNTAAIHCMDPDPEPEEGNGTYPEEADSDLEPEASETSELCEQEAYLEVYKQDDDDAPLIEPLPVRRSRGRPRKHPLA